MPQRPPQRLSNVPRAPLEETAGVTNAQGSRPERIGDQLRTELSALLAREVKDPGIGFVTLLKVTVTADLQLARVYYSLMGDAAARKRTALALERAVPFLRRQIGSRLRLRRVPELRFLFDETVERQDRIEQLLRTIHEAEADQPLQTEGDDPESR